jgi:altronate dehydratase large subunit
MKMGKVFYGYERPKDVGVRNHVLILPTVICSVKTALRIAEAVKGCKVAAHSVGCAQVGEDEEITYRTLRNSSKNPNVTSVLMVSLGCEKLASDKLADDVSKTGKQVELLTIQEIGGTKNAIKKGVGIARKLVTDSAKIKRKAFDLSYLKIAVECGGSDWTSGISANPAVGHSIDSLIDEGGTAVFSETPEIIGAEHIILKRTKNGGVRKKLVEAIRKVENRLGELGVRARDSNPSRGNIAGGMTTLEEKSLGAIYKAGTKPLKGVLGYAEEIPQKAGLYFMDTPGFDVESVTGMVAGGAQLVVFTTGLGTPTGNPIAPVIKVTGNPHTYERLKDNIDINAGSIIEGREDISIVGERILKKALLIASGEKTKAEMLGHDEFSIFRLYPSF